jgi:hypothetical protein
VAHQRADVQLGPVPPRRAQIVQVVQIDQHRGARQPEVEQRDQALAAGQRLCFFAVLPQQTQGLGERGGGVVIERRGGRR